ncbi:response regulator transcription factor [Ideonella azotifigens]|uniref:Response regulatory domain-containing protein n=1 Tax=Ideonella azotifigens TaxID=513160 RepID=A0ABN1JQ33_9BURK|nr:response regulator transcription factor [Ideonella azotifigens]MCD2340139.1 response regulator transcription factor [Ideonella azotifigens]
MPKLKIFVVEDSPIIRGNLVAALEEMAPVTVVGAAEDAQSATQWLVREVHDCDLVIVDIFLKKGSGMDVLRALKEDEHLAARVVLTNFATPSVRSQCASLGADRVFDKSSEIELLIDYCIELAGQGAGGDSTGGQSAAGLQ